MPAIPFVASLLDHVLVHRDTASPPNMTVAVSPSLEVVCAWPVSGQYGPGTRVLYYVLVVACVFARKVEWIRNACLAAVLLFPAIAALHGIVLAVLHVEGAVDMDVYGAFQLCSIGILTAPATVRLSKTYFNNPGRDIIFLWTVLLLVGLISLIVEFMRLEPTRCPSDDPASIHWARTRGPNGGEFKFDSNCGLLCTENDPISPLRRGAADNIYVIPVPSELTFNAATLIAAACCIPAILSLVSMWIKILDEKFLKGKYKQKPDELIEGTNGATVSHMTDITKVIKKWLTILGLPLFAAAVLAILVKGEMNFWSFQMRYQTEPIQSIGQWAPVVGTALAVLGSLYLIFSADIDAVDTEDGQQEEGTVEKCPHCDCAVSITGSSSRRGSRTSDTNTEMAPIRRPTTNTLPDLGRREVARIMSKASALLADKAHKQIEKGGFKRNAKTTYPLTPGEEYKNSKLTDQMAQYQRSSTPDNRSRAASFISTTGSVDNGEGSSRARSPARHSVPARAVSRPITGNGHSNSLPNGGVPRASTLQCPPAAVFGGWQGQSGPFASKSPSRSRAPSASEISPTGSSPGPQFPPKIVISRDEEG